MSGMFQEVEGETVIVAQNGVYKECPVYQRSHGELFAKVGGGFIRLKHDGATSVSKCRIDTLTIANLWRDKVGNLCMAEGDGRMALETDPHYVPLIGGGK